MRFLHIAAFLVAAGILAGCGSDAAAPEPLPWWAGRWNAVSLDGEPLPREIVANGQRFRYDSLTVSFIRFDLSRFGYSGALLPSGDRLGCGGVVNVLFYGDTVRIMAPQALNTCGLLAVSGRNFVRSGANMVHEWEGRRWVLRKAQ